MRGGAIPVLAWGLILAVMMALNWVWTGDAIQIGTFAFAVLVVLTAGLIAVLISRQAIRPGPPEPPPPGGLEPVPDLSVGAAVVGLAIAAIVFGLAFGHFLIYCGAGLLVLGLGRLLVERRAQRRSLERYSSQQAARRREGFE